MMVITALVINNNNLFFNVMTKARHYDSVEAIPLLVLL